MFDHLHGLSEKFMLPLIPAYIITIASTVAFDVDIKTIVAVISLVLAQLWMGIKWGMKIESTQTVLSSRLDNIDKVLENQDEMLRKSEKFDQIDHIIQQSIKKSIEEVLVVHNKLASNSATEAARRV